MKNLETVIAKIEAELDEKDQIREIALKSSRAVVRLSGSALKGLHRGEEVSDQTAELSLQAVQPARGAPRPHPYRLC
jgi:translin